MTVKELIEELAAFNPESQVAIQCEQGSSDPHPLVGLHGGTLLVTLRQVSSSDWNSEAKAFKAISNVR